MAQLQDDQKEKFKNHLSSTSHLNLKPSHRNDEWYKCGHTFEIVQNNRNQAIVRREKGYTTVFGCRIVRPQEHVNGMFDSAVVQVIPQFLGVMLVLHQKSIVYKNVHCINC